MTSDGITYLRLHNFKSWGDTHELGPFSTFTCIVGPNGTGKSNLLDAISFVLGLKTAQLRGNQLQDLLHCKPGGYRASSAFVELEYKTKDEALLVFRRSLTNQGKSVYSYQQKKCSYSDYNKHLEELGILIKARNFLVFQGDVESIASKSSSQLTNVFEQISGSIGLKEDYESLQTIAQEAESAMLRSHEKRKHLEKEKKQIKKQKEEAELYQRKVSVLEELKKDYVLWQLYKLSHETGVLRAEQTELEEKVFDLEEEMEQKHNLVKEIASLYAKHEKERMKRNEMEKKQKRKVKELETQLKRLETKRSHLKKEIQKSTKEEEKTKQEVHQQERVVEELERVIEEAEQSVQEMGEMQTEKSATMELVGNDPELYEEYEQCRLRAERETANVRQNLHPVKASCASEQRQVERLEKEWKRSAKEVEQSENAVRLRKVEVDEQDRKLKELKQTLRKSKDNADRCEKEWSTVSSRKVEIEQKLKQGMHSLGEHKLQDLETERERKQRETVNTLRRLYPAVKGRLAELCRPCHQRYHTAVILALGSHLDAIVVENQSTALECIKYLKTQRIAPCTFLPLDKLQPKELRDQDRFHLEGSLRLVMDVLEYDDHISRAIQYACSDTLVCDSKEEAIGYRAARKIITLDGRVFSRNGNITGGPKSDGTHTSAFTKEEKLRVEYEMKQLQQEYNELPLTSERKYHLAQQRVKSEMIELGHLEKMLERGRERLEQVEKRRDEVVHKHTTREQAYRKGQEKWEKAKMQLSDLEQEYEEVEKKAYASFAEKANVSNLQEWQNERERATQRRHEQRLELMRKLRRYQPQVEYERELMVEKTKRRDEMEGKVTQVHERYHATEQEKREREREIAQLTETMKEIERKGKENEKEMEEMKTQVKERKEEYEAIRKETEQSQKRKQEMQREIDRLQSLVSDRRAACRRECIVLKEVQDTGAIDFTQLRLHRSLETEEEEEFESHAYLIEELARYETHRQHLESEIDKLSLEIESASPDLKAIDRFGAIKQRMRDASGDYDEMRKISKEATNAFETCRTDRIARFRQAFDHVSQCIDTIYKEMTQSRKTGEPGGQAYLHCENAAEPFQGGIQFHAMPPLKRFREMDQLSGGEKTVAALALLFALHSFRPAPFFVLDEIDAALDNANVTKVATYLRHRSTRDRLQFVVISHKEVLYEKSDALVGIYKDQETSSSGFLTLDLNRFGAELEREEERDE